MVNAGAHRNPGKFGRTKDIFKSQSPRTMCRGQLSSCISSARATGKPEVVPGQKSSCRKFHQIGTGKRASRYFTSGRQNTKFRAALFDRWVVNPNPAHESHVSHLHRVIGYR
jgi:hypothetical protein